MDIEPTVFDQKFPFSEIKNAQGDYFNSFQEAMDETGLGQFHIWSFTQSHGYRVYGTAYFNVNVVGYLATTETHDGLTIYQYKYRIPYVIYRYLLKLIRHSFIKIRKFKSALLG